MDLYHICHHRHIKAKGDVYAMSEVFMAMKILLGCDTVPYHITTLSHNPKNHDLNTYIWLS